MKLLKFVLPLLACGALFSTVRANPTYSIYDSANNTTYLVQIDDTTFDASSTLLESMPWWGNDGLAFQLSSPFSNSYYTGGGQAIEAYFALNPDAGGGVDVNTDIPGLPYVLEVGSENVAPYVVLASVPDTSATWLMLGGAVAGIWLLRRRFGAAA